MQQFFLLHAMMSLPILELTVYHSTMAILTLKENLPRAIKSWIETYDKVDVTNINLESTCVVLNRPWYYGSPFRRMLDLFPRVDSYQVQIALIRFLPPLCIVPNSNTLHCQ